MDPVSMRATLSNSKLVADTIKEGATGFWCALAKSAARSRVLASSTAT